MPEQETITQEGITIANHGMKPQYKSDLLSHRMNVETTLDFAILECCERITNDPKLRPFYKSFDMTSLVILQKEMLNFAIAEIPKNVDVNAKIYLRHYQLFDMGFNESHFDLQVGHLIAALQESWLEQEVIDDVESCMGAFRVLFESSSTGKKMAKKCRQKKTINDEETKRGVGRSLSGEGLLAMFKINREKRAKKNTE